MSEARLSPVLRPDLPWKALSHDPVDDYCSAEPDGRTQT